MAQRAKKYRLVVLVGARQIESAWSLDHETVAAELQLIQEAQASGAAVRLPWLGIASGSDVTAAYTEERWASTSASVGVAPSSIPRQF